MSLEKQAEIVRRIREGASRDQLLGEGFTEHDVDSVDLFWRKEDYSWADIANALSSTIKADDAPKVITFAAMLLSKTEDDQINLGFQAESSTGKSYIPLEVAEYFPREDRIEIAGASPTAFFHEYGVWDKNRRVMVTNLEGKILIFLDAPDYRLLEKLRPLLSHDKKILTFKITDKTQKQGLRTKTVEIVGFPTVIFCSTRLNADDQEKTRLLLLSPSVDQAKLGQALEMISRKVSNRSAYESAINSDPRRVFLKRLVERVWAFGARRINIQADILTEFTKREPRHKPRDMRDLPRIASLIKAHALMNYEARQRNGAGELEATAEDVAQGFSLYDKVRVSNELGVSPFVITLYYEIVLPLLQVSANAGVSRKEVYSKFYEVRGRVANQQFFEKEIFPALETAGLIIEEMDPNDKRRKLIYPPDQTMVIPGLLGSGEPREDNSSVRGVSHSTTDGDAPD